MKAANREQELLEEYEGWNPDEESIAELVDRLGVSRQRIYQVLSKHNVTPKSKRSDTLVAGLEVDRGITTEMAEMALGYLVNQLTEARAELAAYREKYGPL